MMIWFSIAAGGVVAFLCWNLYDRLAVSRIEALMEKRRPTSRLVTSGEFVDGNRHLKVAMALTSSHLFYENPDMEASLDLQWIREIQYDTSLATGQTVTGGNILRIRCFSQVFEFVVPVDALSRWRTMLPPRQWKDSTAEESGDLRLAVAT